jgi:pimeloyl-ACP methyl ester carboxylesterase
MAGSWLARQGTVSVRSLGLLEPAASGLAPPDEAAARLAPVVDMARQHGAVAAMDAFIDTVCAPMDRNELDRLVPGALGDARDHADGFFGVELPAAIGWTFSASDASAIDAPVLNVSGADSAPRFSAGAAIIDSWFPTAQPCRLAGLTHLLMAQHPVAVAERLESFWRASG